MIDWWIAPIDAARAHDVSWHVSWHARAMVVAWGGLVPVGILAARFFKVLPGQDWPREVDNRVWWVAHRSCQYLGGALMLAGLWLIWAGEGAPPLHRGLGWAALALAGVQFIAAWARGSKGGPTAPAADGSLRGDHYDMTPRRLVFEYTHKFAGYAALACAAGAILSGLWHANGPRWMWAVILLWWAVLAVLAVVWQRRGMAVDTYQAIWGPDPAHPGNRRSPVGLGVRRRGQG
ncbi:MAG: cytochrome b561 domain-containing protein [Gemmobacter sp.]